MPTNNDASAISAPTYRTTEELVGEIVDAVVSLTPFIMTANQLVTDCCLDAGYSDGKLALIEMWLSAHFYAVSDYGQESRMTSETLADWSGAFMSKVGFDLKLTTYGQQAILLDTDGCLAKLSQSQSGGLISPALDWLGKVPVGYGA